MTSAKRPPFSGYIFDCDGTLAASMILHHGAWESSVRRQVGGNWAFPWDFFCTLGGMSTADTVAVLEARYGFRIDIGKLLPDYHAYLAEHIRDVTPIPETCAFARRMAAAGARLAVASGGFRKEVGEILETIGVKLKDPEKRGCNAMCCGAGGAQIFMDKPSRINILRLEQLNNTGTDEIAVSCPHCLTMLTSAQAQTCGRDETPKPVRDIAEIVAQALTQSTVNPEKEC